MNELIHFSLSLFREHEDFYLLMALANSDKPSLKTGLLLKALKLNPRVL